MPVTLLDFFGLPIPELRKRPIVDVVTLISPPTMNTPAATRVLMPFASGTKALVGSDSNGLLVIA